LGQSLRFPVLVEGKLWLTSAELHVRTLEVQGMAHQDKPHNPDRKQGQQGSGQHQGSEIGRDRDRDKMRDEDLARKQSEGNLGNERNRTGEGVRNRADEEVKNRDRMHDASRLPD
jgi:hypothetical protein